MKDNGGTYVSIYGDRLKKVFRFGREMETFESDVVPAIRTLVDLYYESDEISLDSFRVCAEIIIPHPCGTTLPRLCRKTSLPRLCRKTTLPLSMLNTF